MDAETLRLMSDLNIAINRIRGAYAGWTRENQLKYHEMLILYTLQEVSCCTQKQICDQYLLPKQTVNNIITLLRAQGHLRLMTNEADRRGKYVELTVSGRRYAEQTLSSLRTVEQQAVLKMGADELRCMTDMALRYGHILETVLADAKSLGGSAAT